MAPRIFTPEQFDGIVEEAVGLIPERFHRHMENIRVEVIERPAPEDLERLGLGPRDRLFGLYVGVPLTARSVWMHPMAPTRIEIYQATLEEVFGDDRGQLVEQIRITVIHEIGHHFGLSDDEMAERGFD